MCTGMSVHHDHAGAFREPFLGDANKLLMLQYAWIIRKFQTFRKLTMVHLGFSDEKFEISKFLSKFGLARPANEKL